MQESDKIQVYDNQPIRTAWDEQNEEWYFSIVDVVSVLTDQPDRRRAGKYWSVLKMGNVIKLMWQILNNYCV